MEPSLGVGRTEQRPEVVSSPAAPGPVTWARQVQFPGRAASPPGAGPGSGAPAPGLVLPPSQRQWERLRVPATGYFLHGSLRQLAPQPEAERLSDALLRFSQRRTASIFLTIKYEPTLNTTALQRRPTWTTGWRYAETVCITHLHIGSTFLFIFLPFSPTGHGELREPFSAITKRPYAMQ